MPNSPFIGAPTTWFVGAFEEYRDMYSAGATQAKLRAWVWGKWPEFHIKFMDWMKETPQSNLSIEWWCSVCGSSFLFL